ncbi:type IV toxin-antitoxin system AbiEi family antitoxin domain-containing protein [Nocardioides panacisoli]
MEELIRRQAGVFNRRQALEAGLNVNDLRRMRRRNEIARVHDGVYVDHTGPLTWLQRAWAAVLFSEPAALCGEAARRAADGPGRAGYDDGKPIDVMVDRHRNVVEPPGVRLHRAADIQRRVLWTASPPRERIEHAVVRLAADAPREVDAVAYLADAVQGRQTTAARLAAAIDGRERLARRRFLISVVDDIRLGTCSTLEHGYLTLVERPHGLPLAERQFRESLKGQLYRDAAYLGGLVVVELDGRPFHAKVRQRDRDMERDLDVFAAARATARLGWGQVFDRPCSTAVKIGRGLNERGWAGAVHPCPRCPSDVVRLIRGTW